MFQAKVVEKTKHTFYVQYILKESRRLWDNVEKYCRVEEATHCKMAHAYCMLDNLGHKYTLCICNIYYFLAATMVTLTYLNITLHVL